MGILESASVGTKILKVEATERKGGNRIFYGFHAAQNPASLDLFKMNPTDGTISVKEKIDRERASKHVLVVSARDQGSSRSNFVRVTILVHDDNDHSPEFLSPLIQTKLHETAAVGAEVVEVLAIDNDQGENGRLEYSIASGNVGNSFKIDRDLGWTRVARQLDTGPERHGAGGSETHRRILINKYGHTRKIPLFQVPSCQC